MWFLPLLRHVWEYSQYCIFCVCGSTPVSTIPILRECSHKSGIVLLGVLIYYRLHEQCSVPLLWEHSQKSFIVLPGVLLKKLKLYTWSDLDLIYNLDILLPLDTLGVLPVLLLLVSGSTPGRLIFCQWEYSHKSGIVLPGVLPKRLFLYTGSDLDMIYNLAIWLPLDTLGVLPECLVMLFPVGIHNCWILKPVIHCFLLLITSSKRYPVKNLKTISRPKSIKYNVRPRN